MQVTPTQESLSNELDEVMLKALLAAKASGEVNAALLNACTARLKALGITTPHNPDSATEQLAQEVGLSDPNVLKMPDISDEPESAIA